MSGKNLGLGLLLLAALLVGIKLVYFGSSKDDATLIRQALAESIQASKEGRAGGVLDKISDDFQINSESPNARQIAAFVRKSKPDVVVLQPDPAVDSAAGTAQIHSSVKLGFDVLTQHINQEIPNVTIRFKREDSHVWLIFPAKQWRVTEVTVPPESYQGLASLPF